MDMEQQQRMQRRFALLLVGVVLLATVAAGCGSDSRAAGPRTKRSSDASTYERQIRRVHEDMNEAMSAAFATRQLDRKLVRTARTTASRSLETLQSAKPPKRYAKAHDEYVLGLETFVAILTDVERQVDQPDLARRHLGDKRFTTGVAHLEKASKLFAKAGLDLNAATGEG